MSYKRPSPKKPVLITALIFALLGGFMTSQFPTTDSILTTIAVSLTMAGSSAILGAIVGFIIYVIFKPSNTSILLREQTELLRNKMGDSKGSKADELNKIAELRKNGAITEEEFNRLKNEILNRK
ncbi:SHOCT domain-containing protein [Clostridium pasteurianum]|uniref:SHOCT domain-containing protein n=1 Tax=Clostridium pasteurianum BC1 TaxID=86416 RepID=R4K0K6_CLOPA|nr:SHOCT domain-containing protein [Clostridium pasteurianum]AGK96617.1 hypothetical protein Clopa_1695 [Clostridium pasteurianum BC1]